MRGWARVSREVWVFGFCDVWLGGNGVGVGYLRPGTVFEYLSFW